MFLYTTCAWHPFECLGPINLSQQWQFSFTSIWMIAVCQPPGRFLALGIHLSDCCVNGIYLSGAWDLGSVWVVPELCIHVRARFCLGFYVFDPSASLCLCCPFEWWLLPGEMTQVIALTLTRISVLAVSLAFIWVMSVSLSPNWLIVCPCKPFAQLLCNWHLFKWWRRPWYASEWRQTFASMWLLNFILAYDC